MKSVIAFLAATVAALAMAENCDLGAIQSALYPNATQGLLDCSNATGVDIFALTEFPTEEEAQAVFQDRDCVDYYNQINQVANAEIQCTINVGGTDVVFAELITSLLTGHTGNESDSDSGSVEFPESDSGSSDVDSGASDASEASDAADSASGNATDASASSSNAAGAGRALSLVAAGAAALIAAALH